MFWSKYVFTGFFTYTFVHSFFNEFIVKASFTSYPAIHEYSGNRVATDIDGGSAHIKIRSTPIINAMPAAGIPTVPNTIDKITIPTPGVAGAPTAAPTKCDPAQTTNVPAIIAIVSGWSKDSTTARAPVGMCGSDRRMASSILSVDHSCATSMFADMVSKTPLF